MQKPPRPERRPEYRTGLRGDPSAWTPARTYAYVRRLFRRNPDEPLCLDQKEFEAVQDAYVRHQAQGYRFRRMFAALFPGETGWRTGEDKPTHTKPRRKYDNRKRASQLDDWCPVEMGGGRRAFRPGWDLIVRELAAAEFVYLILRGEYRTLSKLPRRGTPSRLSGKGTCTFPTAPVTHISPRSGKVARSFRGRCRTPPLQWLVRRLQSGGG
jgi:hypothetical protein